MMQGHGKWQTWGNSKAEQSHRTHTLSGKSPNVLYWETKFIFKIKSNLKHTPNTSNFAFFRKYFLIQKSKCNFVAIVKVNKKYPLNVFCRVLSCLLAFFYVSIFTIEAIHGHDSPIENSSADGLNDGLDAVDCKICVYFAHHEKEEIAVSTIISFALFIFQDDSLTIPELTRFCQTSIQDFINRGPPCLFV